MQPQSLPEIAETTLPSGCAACGGDVHIKVVHGSATSYCAHCHWIGRPVVKVKHDGLHVGFKAAERV